MEMHLKPQSTPIGLRILVLLLMCHSLAGCSVSSNVRTIIHEDPQSQVFLGWVPEESFRASHPTDFSPILISRILSGVMIQEPPGILEGLVSQEARPSHVFSDDDVELLIPHLVSALSQATPEEHVVFQRVYSQNPGAATTAGTLYVHEDFLFLTMTNFGRKQGGPSVTLYKGNRNIAGTSGLKEFKVSFIPEAAWHRDVSPTREPSGQDPPTTLVLDYKKLTSLPLNQKDSISAIRSREGLDDQQTQAKRRDHLGKTSEQTGFESQGERETPIYRTKKDHRIKDLEEKFNFLKGELLEVQNEIERLKKSP